MLRLVLIVLASEVIAQNSGSCSSCKTLQTIHRTLQDGYEDQPQFVNFAPATTEGVQLDNACHTVCKTPDGGYALTISRVYCDGSRDVVTYLIADTAPGTYQVAGPFCTFKQLVFGQAGCDTNLQYRCYLYGACPNETFNSDSCKDAVFGLTTVGQPITPSCLCEVKKLLRANGLCDQDIYPLPMKLPTNCVTGSQCVIPSNNNTGGCSAY